MKRQLLFLHVNKTAGSTLTGVLSNRFVARDCLALYFGREPEVHDLQRFRYITGHLTFSILDLFEGPPFVFTFLRDPIERALSAYSFYRTFFPPDYRPPRAIYDRSPRRYELLTEFMRLARECTIEELIDRAPEAAREFLGNRQARTLSRSHPLGRDESLDEALEGLERCDFVGLSEHVHESVQLLTRRLGWRPLGAIPRANVTPVRLGRDGVLPEGMDALRDLTAVDRELYDRGRELYDRQLADWGTEADGSDRSAEIPDAAPTSDLTFDDPIPGGGWLIREQQGGWGWLTQKGASDGPWFCWIGSTATAWVDLAARDAKSLVVEIAHVLDQSMLETLRLTLDGKVVRHKLTQSGGAVIASARIPRRLRRSAGSRRVQLTVDRAMRPCDVDPASTDNRELAIAVRRIALQ
jgi:hypothetical protein